MARRPSVLSALYLDGAPEAYNPFAVPLGPYAERVTGRKTTAKQKGDKPLDLNVRVKPKAAISRPNQGYVRRAEQAVSRAVPALEPVINEIEDFASPAAGWDALVRMTAALRGQDVYRGNADLAGEDASLFAINALAGPAFGLAGKGIKKVAGMVPASVREGASDLAARAGRYLRDVPGAPLRDADYVEGLFNVLPEGVSDFAVRPQIAPPPQTLAAFRDIRPARENVGDVMRANTTAGRIVGERMRPLSELTGGVSDALDDQRRVAALVDAMSGPEGYIERLIVDDAGNVIEGQHRLDALRRLGVQEVPVIEYRDLERGLPLFRMRDAAAAQGIHPDQAQQIAQQLAEIYADEGGDMAEIAMYDAPRGFENAWQAAMDALKQNGAAPYKRGGLAVKRKAR